MTFKLERTNALFHVLSHQRRRYVLSYFRSADHDVVNLADIAEWVGEREAASESDRAEAVAVALHHTHLPKLAEIGVIDYDARTETVRHYGTKLGDGSSAKRRVSDLS